MLGAFAVKDLLARARRSIESSAKENIYTRIGVTPIINARGTWTYISGSLELPEVRQAKQDAAMHFVDMWELQRAVSKRLAELSGAEAGLVIGRAYVQCRPALIGCVLMRCRPTVARSRSIPLPTGPTPAYFAR